MSHAGKLIEDYFQRKGQPRDTALDAAYQFEMTVLRDMISRLEVILEDEGVPSETAVRVIRCLLYGAPSAADAELRMQQQAEMVKLLQEMPPKPFDLGAAGLPPLAARVQDMSARVRRGDLG